MPRVLIVAYGNPLRNDDGIAWRAAAALEGRFQSADVEIVRLHQLAPELAETVRHFGCLVFIDAASPREGKNNPGEIHIEQIRAERIRSSDTTRFSHVLTPHTVTALATTLYGAKQQAFLVTVNGENFEHGEVLSPAVAAALSDLVARVERVVEKYLSKA